MNWIFEVYGNTYSTVLMQDRGPNTRPVGEGAVSRSWPDAIGSLFGRR